MEFTLFRPPPFAVILCKTFSITKKKYFHSYAVKNSVDIHSLCLDVYVLRKRVNHLREGRQAFPGVRVNLFRMDRQMLN